jgi:uncharacterized membrane protein
MAIVSLLSLAVHLLVGAVWVGALAFTAGVVLPVARAGRMNAEPLGAIGGSLQLLTRGSAALLLLTGGHLLVARGYLDGGLFAPAAGHLVVTMFVLWLVATGLTEAGLARLLAGTDDDKVREPAREATRLLQAAAVTGGLVLVDAAALVTTT